MSDVSGTLPFSERAEPVAVETDAQWPVELLIVRDYLSWQVGREHARSAREVVAAVCHPLVKDDRDVRDIVSDLNARGVPIATGRSGYWWGTCWEDFDEMLHRFRSHRDSLHARILHVEMLRAKRFDKPEGA